MYYIINSKEDLTKIIKAFDFSPRKFKGIGYPLLISSGTLKSWYGKNSEEFKRADKIENEFIDSFNSFPFVICSNCDEFLNGYSASYTSKIISIKEYEQKEKDKIKKEIKKLEKELDLLNEW